MKKVMILITFIMLNQAFALNVVCNEVAFEGNDNGVAANFPETVYLERLSSEEIMISKSEGANGIIVEKKFENTHRDFVGYAHYRTNYFGEKVRVGVFYLGNKKKSGQAFYNASSGCRGGYSSGCSSVGKKTYSCQAL